MIVMDGQNIIYCPGINKAITYALDFAKNKGKKDNQELITLAKDIKNEVHRDYYLADLIPKGVAYHIGYLPSTIKMRIEELYREGLIETLFCTSTLMEGVNLPADNLFVTDYKIGRGRMSAIDFKNLIGRVGRIEYNLYGNVFLMRPEEKIKSEIFIELLKEDIQEQKLSVVTELSNNQKVKIVESLVKGDVQLTQYPKNQTVEEYSLMRKFTGILLRDIMQSNKSLVWKEFSHLLNKYSAPRCQDTFFYKIS
jgi:replicative superfamily II helicase